MADDNKIQFAADAKECAYVNFASVRIPLAKFNRWQRNPAELSDTIGALQRLQRGMQENRDRIAGQQAQVRRLSAELNREMER